MLYFVFNYSLYLYYQGVLSLILFSLSETVKNKWSSDVEFIVSGFNSLGLRNFGSSNSSSHIQKTTNHTVENKSNNSIHDDESPKQSLNISSHSIFRIESNDSSNRQVQDEILNK